ncbi:MAG TPA: cobalt ECF transporter T component CbiQ [Vicinamibacterales bacterium]|nr:cobalt ECF transporter T component CbiQ [Vicinamibacterales bacterium]
MARRRGHVERTIDALLEVMDRAGDAERRAAGSGLLQRLDPRVKVVGLLALIVAVAMARNLPTLVALLAVALAGAVLSRLPFRLLVTRLWIGPLALTGVIAFPALFTTPGDAWVRVPGLGWTATLQGLTSATYLVLRVLTAATLAFLLVFTTPWTHVLKALRIFRVPKVAVVVLGMTWRYILLLLQAAHRMFEARRSRSVGPLPGRERRRVTTAAAGVLLDRSMRLSQDVYLAMQSRGFRGEVHVADEFRMRPGDWAALCAFAALAALFAFSGRG